MESASLMSGMAENPQPGPSGMARRSVPLLSDRPRGPPPKDPSPPPLWKEGNTFSSVLEKYSGWKGSQLTPKKRELLTYAMMYHDDIPSDTHSSSDDDADVSKRIGIEGVTEILQEGARVMGEKSGLQKKVGLEKMPK